MSDVEIQSEVIDRDRVGAFRRWLRHQRADQARNQLLVRRERRKAKGARDAVASTTRSGASEIHG